MEMYKLDETDGAQPVATSAPAQAPAVQSQLSSQDQVKKNDMLRQLFMTLDLLIKEKSALAKTRQSESVFSSNIAKAIMEEFSSVFEADNAPIGKDQFADYLTNDPNTNVKIDRLNSQLDSIMANLQAYKNEPDVAAAFKRVQNTRASTYALAKPYTPKAEPAATSASTAPVKPSAQAPTKAAPKAAAKPTTATAKAPVSTPKAATGQSSIQYNPAVAAMQNALNTAGAKLEIDGKLGPKTQAAMAQFPNIAQGYKLPKTSATAQAPASATSAGYNDNVARLQKALQQVLGPDEKPVTITGVMDAATKAAMAKHPNLTTSYSATGASPAKPAPKPAVPEKSWLERMVGGKK